MTRENPSTENKQALRKQFLSCRKKISHERRKQAAKIAFEKLVETSFQNVLCYFPLSLELDISSLIQYLMEQKRLFLPRVVKPGLSIYSVENFMDLILSDKGIWEPNPEKCTPYNPSEMDLVLVPALAFDAQCNRLGYGGGFYDRLLLQTTKAHTLGIGFHEQLSKATLPVESWDIPVKELYFF